jgi:hypothetical protein
MLSPGSGVRRGDLLPGDAGSYWIDVNAPSLEFRDLLGRRIGIDDLLEDGGQVSALIDGP